MDNLPILVIFDIDETLLQFMGGAKHHFLDEVSVEDRKTIQDSQIEYLDKKALNIKNKTFFSECALFRPHLRTFLELVKKNPRIHIAIWTYAEHDYAVKVAEIITSHFGFSKNPFVFTYGAEDMDDENYPKSLRQIWSNFKQYNKFNTLIVDDRLGNLSHDHNLYNAVVCQGFAPFSERKTRLPLTKESLAASINDTMFLELIKIIDNSFKYINGCSDEECAEAFAEEHIFSSKIIKKNGNIKYVQAVKSEDDIYQMVSIGDVSIAGSEHKGGSVKKYIKRSSRKTKKNKVNKKRYTKKK
jgi:hypothetical protein